MQLPLIEALRRAAPEARITALAAAPAVELLRGDRTVDEVQCTQDFGALHLWSRTLASGFAAWLRLRRFDLVIDPHTAPESIHRELWQLDTAFRESDQAAERRTLHAGGSSVDALAAGAAAGWGIAVDTPARVRLRLSRRAHARARELLRRAGAPDGAVAIAPFASRALKQWPVERFARAAAALAGARPLVVLDAPGSDAAGRVLSLLPARVRACRVPPHPLDVLAAVISRCSLLLCNDTGVMHVAGAVGTRTVSVFGPTAAEVFAPRGTDHLSVGSAVECEHRHAGSLTLPACWSAGECLQGLRSCIDDVSVEELVAAVDDARGQAI